MSWAIAPYKNTNLDLVACVYTVMSTRLSMDNTWDQYTGMTLLVSPGWMSESFPDLSILRFRTGD